MMLEIQGTKLRPLAIPTNKNKNVQDPPRMQEELQDKKVDPRNQNEHNVATSSPDTQKGSFHKKIFLTGGNRQWE